MPRLSAAPASPTRRRGRGTAPDGGRPSPQRLGDRRWSKGRRRWMSTAGSRGRRGTGIRQGRPERFRPRHPEGRNAVKDPGGREPGRDKWRGPGPGEGGRGRRPFMLAGARAGGVDGRERGGTLGRDADGRTFYFTSRNDRGRLLSPPRLASPPGPPCWGWRLTGAEPCAFSCTAKAPPGSARITARTALLGRALDRGRAVRCFLHGEGPGGEHPPSGTGTRPNDLPQKDRGAPEQRDIIRIYACAMASAFEADLRQLKDTGSRVGGRPLPKGNASHTHRALRVRPPIGQSRPGRTLFWFVLRLSLCCVFPCPFL
jgi:hypothetical protein